MINNIKKMYAYTAIVMLAMSQTATASSYQQVYDLVFAPPSTSAKVDTDPIINAEKAVYNAGKLPAYKVTFFAFTKSAVKRLENRSKQTLVDKVDYYDRLDKLVHSNGICMAGKWQINKTATNAEKKSYTGMFAKGASSLFIGRLSVALTETKHGEKQAFSLAGKIFGTHDVNKDVTTESFFVGDVLSGIKRDSVFSAPMSTNPQIKFRLKVIPLAFKIGGLFGKADKNAGIRPVTGIARMGMNNKKIAQYVSPKYMMLQPIMPKGHTTAKGIDFRDEFALSKQGKQKGSRDFKIFVSDVAKYDTKNLDNNDWQEVGMIKATETVVSYGCDRQLHFAHPKSE